MLDAMVTHYTSGNKAKFAQLLGVQHKPLALGELVIRLIPN